MNFEKSLYNPEGLDDLLDNEIYEIQKLDVEEETWQNEPDSFISYDTNDDYTFVDTNEEGINDLICDEIYEIQKNDVETQYWGDLLDETDLPSTDTGRSENSLY